jgi:hypothetical protein
MLEVGLVDRVEAGGIPLLPGLDGLATLTLHSSEVFDSGIVPLKYDVSDLG